MNRRIVGVLLALALAVVGTVALVGYVQSAKDEAVAGEKLVEAFVVRGDVSEGASIDAVRDAVERTEVPAKVRPEDAVTDLDALGDDLVAGVDLAPGELLLRSRLVRAEQLNGADVPEGLQEMTVGLTPERAVGGTVRAGDTVGIVVSFEPFDSSGGEGGDNADKTPNMSHLLFHKVRVTNVQFDQNEAETPAQASDDGGDQVDRAPSNELLVTLALSSPQVEQVVFGAEFGHIWLTDENDGASEDGTSVVTLGKVYGSAVAGLEGQL